jgi:hypothetical protein
VFCWHYDPSNSFKPGKIFAEVSREGETRNLGAESAGTITASLDFSGTNGLYDDTTINARTAGWTGSGVGRFDNFACWNRVLSDAERVEFINAAWEPS